MYIYALWSEDCALPSEPPPPPKDKVKELKHGIMQNEWTCLYVCLSVCLYMYVCAQSNHFPNTGGAHAQSNNCQNTMGKSCSKYKGDSCAIK